MPSTNKGVRIYPSAFEAVCKHMKDHGSGQNEAASLLILDGVRWQAQQMGERRRDAEKRKAEAK